MAGAAHARAHPAPKATADTFTVPLDGAEDNADPQMPVILSALHVYPVKGLKGIAVPEARCTDRGLEHDRRWMVVDEHGDFLSQREHPAMATVWTDIDGDRLELSAPDAGRVELPLRPRDGALLRVSVWESECDALAASPEADAWLSACLGLPCRLVYMPEETRRESNPRHAGAGRLVGFADAFAYLLTGESSLAELNARLVARNHPAVPMNRFRPNLVVAGAPPFAEDGWTDMRIGTAAFRMAKPCGRCQVTTTDQATGELRGPEPLATLASYRSRGEYGITFGVNLVTERTGVVRVGEAVQAPD